MIRSAEAVGWGLVFIACAVYLGFAGVWLDYLIGTEWSLVFPSTRFFFGTFFLLGISRMG